MVWMPPRNVNFAMRAGSNHEFTSYIFRVTCTYTFSFIPSNVDSKDSFCQFHPVFRDILCFVSADYQNPCTDTTYQAYHFIETVKH